MKKKRIKNRNDCPFVKDKFLYFYSIYFVSMNSVSIYYTFRFYTFCFPFCSIY